MRHTFVVTIDAKREITTDEIAEHLSTDDARAYFDVKDVERANALDEVSIVRKGTPSYDLVKSVRGLIAMHVAMHEGEHHPDEE